MRERGPCPLLKAGGIGEVPERSRGRPFLILPDAGYAQNRMIRSIRSDAPFARNYLTKRPILR